MVKVRKVIGKKLDTVIWDVDVYFGGTLLRLRTLNPWVLKGLSHLKKLSLHH